jgi:predicted RNase H-like HicB family nuclease
MATLRPTPIVRLPSYVVRDGDAWVAHCVPLGVASQGESLLEAIELLDEATTETIANLTQRGADPLTSRKPCRETLEEFLALQSQVQIEVDVDHIPEGVTAILFELMVPMAQQSNSSETVKLAKTYDHLSAPFSMAS